MNSPFPLLALALFGLVACEESPSAPLERPSLASGGASAPYTARFADAPGDNLRSDNGTVYLDGGPNYNPNCGLSSGGSAGGGVYQLRTIANTAFCKGLLRGVWRFFKVDFGGPHMVDLDQDGDLSESVEETPARMLAANAFAQGATSTLVRILILKVNANGSTEQDTIWELRYRGLVPASGTGIRVIQASSGSATVDIYTGLFVKGAQPIATIGDLPFKLTLTPQ